MKFINRKFVLLILGLIMISHQANAQEKTFDESVLSDKGKQAYQKLLKVEIFEAEGIGYSGESSAGRKAFYILLAEEQSKTILALKSLVKDATIEGGLYGLLGLKTFNCDCFQEQFKSFKSIRTSESNKEKLIYESGCTLHIIYEKSKDKEDFIDLLVTQMFDSWAMQTERRRNLKN